MRTRTINISIKSSPKLVYDFVSHLENLSRWAPSTFSAIKEVNGEGLVDTPHGQIKVRFEEKNNFGILDHYVKLTSEKEIYIPMRVLKNNDGSEIIFTLFQYTPEITDENFAEDVKIVKRELNQLKTIIEER